MLFCCEKMRLGYNSWSRHKLVSTLFPFLSLSLLLQSFVCVDNTPAKFWNEVKRAKMAIFGSKCHFWTFLRLLDRTVHRTVMHRHDGPLIIPKWRSNTVIYGVHRQTVFWRTVLSHRHCTALMLILQVRQKITMRDDTAVVCVRSRFFSASARFQE